MGKEKKPVEHNNPHIRNAGQGENTGYGQDREDADFAHKLKQALLLSATTSTIASPVKHGQLLEIIVETASRVTSSEAASLFLIDEEAQELVFEVALGQKGDEVRKFRVPMGHGIAGLVAVTGQPMMVTDVHTDPRHASDISQAIGYVPKSILCFPLIYDEEVIGVIELFDKLGGEPFGMDDMDIVGYFARMASVAIEQSRTRSNIATLLSDIAAGSVSDGRKDSKSSNSGKGSKGSKDEEDNEAGYTSDGIKVDAQLFSDRLQVSAQYDQAMDLATMIQEIVEYGESESRACRTILEAFTDYLRAKPRLGESLGVGRR